IIPSDEGPDDDAPPAGKHAWLGKVITDIEAGHVDRYPHLVQIIEEYQFNLRGLWEELGQVSRRCESLAHKQLRGIEPNDSERAFIRSYGQRLARVMLYGGNAWLTPRDDAPRIVDVYADPSSGRYLHVGIGRSRTLYVLHPWQGRSVLCTGAILPYYEFTDGARLDDAAWKERLDSDRRPPIPSWFVPIVSGGKLSVPETGVVAEE
ncbi:MAG: DUF3160 domain-containing protein, partial [Guyparkeria sp.]